MDFRHLCLHSPDLGNCHNNRNNVISILQARRHQITVHCWAGLIHRQSVFPPNVLLTFPLQARQGVHGTGEPREEAGGMEVQKPATVSLTPGRLPGTWRVRSAH